jgi:hypothetical protein
MLTQSNLYAFALLSRGSMGLKATQVFGGVVLSCVLSLLAACGTTDRGRCLFKANLTPMQTDLPLSLIGGAGGAAAGENIQSDGFQAVEVEPQRQIGEYLLTMTIGNQETRLVADTGSSGLVILGAPSFCSNCSNGPFAQFATYDPSLSVTSNIGASKTFRVAYGSGNATAVLIKDSVKVVCDKEEVQDYDIGVIKQNNNLPNILGLAAPSLVEPRGQNILPFFDQMLSSYPGRMQNILGITLCSEKDGSRLVFGGPDDRVTDRAHMIWVPQLEDSATHRDSYYNIPAFKISVQGWVFQREQWSTDASNNYNTVATFPPPGVSGTMNIFLDTGSTLNYLTTEAATRISALLRTVNKTTNAGIGDDFFSANPKNPMSQNISEYQLGLFPTLYLEVKSLSGTIEKLRWPPSVYFKKNPPSARSNQRSYSLLQGRGRVILGQASPLEAYYVEHDRGNRRLGFYPNTTLCN